MDIDISFYNAGTATVSGVTVTGQGTAWAGAVRKGDLFGTHKGAGVRIASVDSNTSLTLAYEIPALEQEEAPYEIQFTPYDTGYQKAVRDLLTVMTNGNLEALASLPGASDLLPIFTGSGAMSLVPKTDLVSGVAYDAQVDDLAGRAAYDGQAGGFAVLVADTGDGRAAVYSKLSADNADWSGPAYVTGPAITLDVTEVDDAPYGTPPDVTLEPVAGGYDMRWVIPTGMIIEPGTITTLPPGQSATWEWEPIEGGYRVHIAVPRGPTGDINGVTPFWVSRLGADEDAAAARQGLGATPTGSGLFTAATADAARTLLELGSAAQADYEEGTWTPSLAGFTTPGNPTYVAQQGTFIRIGRLVMAHTYLVVSAIGGAAGVLMITGLPFAVRGGAVARSLFMPSFWNGITLPAGSTGLYGFGIDNNDTIRLYRSTLTGSTSQVTDAHVTGTITIYGMTVYEAA